MRQTRDVDRLAPFCSSLPRTLLVAIFVAECPWPALAAEEGLLDVQEDPPAMIVVGGKTKKLDGPSPTGWLHGISHGAEEDVAVECDEEWQHGSGYTMCVVLLDKGCDYASEKSNCRAVIVLQVPSEPQQLQLIEHAVAYQGKDSDGRAEEAGVCLREKRANTVTETEYYINHQCAELDAYCACNASLHEPQIRAKFQLQQGAKAKKLLGEPSVGRTSATGKAEEPTGVREPPSPKQRTQWTLVILVALVLPVLGGFVALRVKGRFGRQGGRDVRPGSQSVDDE